MIAVTGTAGQLGRAFMDLVPDAISLTRSDLDLSNPDSVASRLDEIGCDTLINCAAYTAVDRAETDEATATDVNARSVEAMAAWAHRRSVPFVTYSTDYVFDGTKVGPYVESDAPNPQGAYGRSKRTGEVLAMAANPDCLIIRTSWIISGTHPNFVSTILKLVQERPVAVVDDQRGCPTVAADLARHTMRLVEASASGLVHATNQGVTTWFQLARDAVRYAGFDPDQITPCTTDEYPRPARRPANSQLVSERYPEVGVMPEWSDSLPAVVDGVLGWL